MSHEQKRIVTTVRKIKFNANVNSLKLITDTTITFYEFSKHLKPSYRIVLIVDGSCSTCFEILSKWNDLFLKEHLDYNKLIIFGYDNTFIQLKYVKTLLPQLKGAVFFDPEYEFGKLNNVDQNGINKFLLVDKDYNVVTASNPFLDKSIMNTYLHYIQ